MSERLMMDLAQQIGKQSAHQLLYQIANNARQEEISFSEALQKDEAIHQYYSSEELTTLLDPHTYIGTAVEQSKKVVALFKKRHPEVMK